MLVLILFMSLLSAAPQSKTGEIKLEVKDPLGSPMQAAGTLQGLGTGDNRTFETDAQGAYTFEKLPYGRYRLEVSRDGFATQTALIDVQSETPVSRGVTMAIGAVAYKVDVVSATPLAGVELSLKDIAAPVQ